MLLIIAILVLVTPIWSQTELVAKYNINGVTGTIAFTQQAVGSDVTMTLNLEGVSSGSYILKLHEYRVNYDLADRCADSSLGTVIGSATVTSGKGTIVVGGMDLSGTKSIEGRSFVIEGGPVKACATIEADAEYITAFANFPAALGGTVVFRQQEASAESDTMIYLNLYFVGTDKPTSAFKWQITSGTVKMDTMATTNVADRCGSTIGTLYNPTASQGAGCSTTNHANCAIGSLSQKHGDVMIAASGNTRKFFGDLSLPLSGANSIIGKTIVVMDQSSRVFACANIVEYPTMAAAARFSNSGVSGEVSFLQRSPLDTASLHVMLTNPASEGRRYSIAKFPVPQKVTQSQAVCESSSIGDTFNPFTAQTVGIEKSTTPDGYPVGDLSGKFGSLDAASINKTMVDVNLQLFGRNSVIGRSLVIYNAQQQRWVCSTIRSTLPTTTAVVKFTYPVIGYIVLQQPRDMWYADTQIYIELDYGTLAGPTYAHDWHIHEYQTGNDTLTNTGPCKSVGGHYNPYDVDKSGDYASGCNPNNPFRCEVGDLSKKHEQINIRSSSGSRTKFFFSDPQLPLHGPQTVIGRSITIHSANSVGDRLSCANVMEQKERELKVKKWSAASGMSSPAGEITFRQLCTDIWTCESRMNLQLSSLGSVAGYHIHEYPTTTDVDPAKTCQGDDVGGHFNPLGGPAKGPESGTNDMYEIGDLSGKFGNLHSGSVTTEAQDQNLPLEGPLSVARRSVVIHADSGARWACGNIEDVHGHLVQAKATFTGEYTGYIMLSQYQYEDGSKSPTSILVDVRNQQGTLTSSHNWHVHETRRNATDNTCTSCNGHYNPFMVDMGAGYSECGMGNPLRCEVGDQSNKLGQYDISSGKAFYTDVNLDVEGTFSAAKRSFVIHTASSGKPRMACANLVPYGASSRSSNFGFLTTAFDNEELEAVIAGAIETDEANVLAVSAGADSTCARATIYFLGTNKIALYQKFEDLLKSGNHRSLGRFKPDGQCTTSSAGLAQVSLHIMILTFLLALFVKRR